MKDIKIPEYSSWSIGYFFSLGANRATGMIYPDVFTTNHRLKYL